MFYGGAAGGAKSSALLMAALEFVDVKGYAAVLLRRTYADLSKPGALMDRAHQWLRGTSAKWNEQKKQWTFPSGATLTFGYLENENDKYQYQGAEYQFCVARDTPILMADGSYQPIWTIKVGDEVQTLIGARRVSRVTCAGRKSVTEVVTDKGARIKVSSLHPMLTASGWASPQVLRTTQFHASDSTREALERLHSKSRKPVLCLPSGLPLTAERGLRSQVKNLRLDYDASLRGGRTDFLKFGDARPELLRPEPLIVPVVLLEQAIPSGEQDFVAASLLHALARARYGNAYTLDSRFCYRTERGSGGEPSQSALVIDLTRTPSQDGVAESSPAYSSADDQAHIQAHNQTAQCRYNHPYTNAVVDSTEAVRPAFVCMTPKGEAEVWDLTVDDASHYVTYGGIISQNCGFDELTQFTETAYTYLFSRLRRLAGVDIPLRMRSASNPGGIGARWVHHRFVPEKFTPHDAEGNEVWWKEGFDLDGNATRRAFIPARLDDNPYLDRQAYAASLNELDPVTREQLLKGDWRIVDRGDIYPMWDERQHVIPWSAFNAFYRSNGIPEHWQHAVFMDVGTTEGHPNVTSWFATAPENAPLSGSVFLHRGQCVYDWTVRQIAEHINTVARTEKNRTNVWRMSHEGNSERIAYNREFGIPFAAWKADRNRGIAQVRNYLEIQHRSQPHPFNDVDGRPALYLIVDDDQADYPRNDRGLARWREEFPAYHYKQLRSGETAVEVVPHPLFNDAMDTVRAAGAEYFAPIVPLTRNERVERQLEKVYKGRTYNDILALPPDVRDGAIHAYQDRQAELIRADKSATVVNSISRWKKRKSGTW